MVSARAISTARLGRVGVRWASTTVLPSRVALKAHRASLPKAAAMLGVGWLGSVSSLGGPLLLVAGGVVSVSSDRFLVGVGLVVAGVVLGVSELVGD